MSTNDTNRLLPVLLGGGAAGTGTNPGREFPDPDPEIPAATMLLKKGAFHFSYLPRVRHTYTLYILTYKYYSDKSKRANSIPHEIRYVEQELKYR